jgi:uncharacterized protein YjlB
MTTVTPDVLRFTFTESGAFPNNPQLPLVVYRQVIRANRGEELAAEIEKTVKEHAWTPAWRWGIHDFPHYHSTTHEFLGVFSGTATVRLGHENGVTLIVEPGDVIVIPAGVAHQNLKSSSDFQVVGAYPRGQSADLLRGDPGERPDADERIARVPLPVLDPLYGYAGPLVELWKLGVTE